MMSGEREVQERTIEEGEAAANQEEHGRGSSSSAKAYYCSTFSFPFFHKIVAEILGTYFLIFAGCASVVVNISKGSATFPGICVVWGLSVTVLIYSIGHVSGAHLNPAVTIAFAACGRFPWREVPAYIVSHVFASTLASETLRLLFSARQELFAGTIPAGSNIQSLVLEFILSFYLMFVISGVATDSRSVGELTGIVVGTTVLLTVFFAGQKYLPISGASMNPARSLGPALVWNRSEGIWVYILGPIAGTVAAAWAYNLIRHKPLARSTTSNPTSVPQESGQEISNSCIDFFFQLVTFSSIV